MYKPGHLAFVLYITFLLTACERTSDLTPLVSRFESQSDDFEMIAQEILEYPEVNSIHSKIEERFSIRYQNDEAKARAYKYPVTMKTLEAIGSTYVDVVHVLSTDENGRIIETREIEKIKIGYQNKSHTTGPRSPFKPLRLLGTGWVYLPLEPDPSLLMPSSMCYESLLDNYVDPKTIPPYQIEIYLPTKVPNWYVYCSIEHPDP
jgi:hypothetical protein